MAGGYPSLTAPSNRRTASDQRSAGELHRGHKSERIRQVEQYNRTGRRRRISVAVFCDSCRPVGLVVLPQGDAAPAEEEEQGQQEGTGGVGPQHAQEVLPQRDQDDRAPGID